MAHNGEVNIAEFSNNAIFTCTASGLPLPQIEWLHDGAVLSNDDQTVSIYHYVVSSSGDADTLTVSTLKISSVELSNGGTYTCRAVSGNVSPVPGQSAVTFELVVVGELYCVQMYRISTYMESIVDKPISLIWNYCIYTSTYNQVSSYICIML